MSATDYYSSAERSGYPAPPGLSHRVFRDRAPEMPGSFKAPGRLGILISVDDYNRWLASHRPVA